MFRSGNGRGSSVPVLPIVLVVLVVLSALAGIAAVRWTPPPRPPRPTIVLAPTQQPTPKPIFGYAVFRKDEPTQEDPGVISSAFVVSIDTMTLEQAKASHDKLVGFEINRAVAAHVADEAAVAMIGKLRSGDFSDYPGATGVFVSFDAGPDYPAGGDYVERDNP